MNTALLREAAEELGRRKLRTLLTLLGMIFGVGAIVAMLAVGEGSKREALKLVAELGLNNILVRSKELDQDTLKELRARTLGLTLADAQAAALVVPGAVSVSVYKAIQVNQLSAGAKVREDAELLAVSNEYREHAGLELTEGRWFTDEDQVSQAPVVVLGAKISNELFPGGDAVGQLIKANHVWMEVVGVLGSRDIGKNDFEGVKLGLDAERLFMPIESGLARFRIQAMEDQIDQLSVQLGEGQSPEAAARVLQQLISDRHSEADDFTLIVPAGLYRQQQQTQRIFTVVMSSIAAISLIVGGIGIMNIMLANVLERKREIGLKRAIGARRQDVIDQFLAESLVISVTGALAGLLFGILVAYAIAFFAGWSVAWSPVLTLLAVAVCIAVGVAFGVYPARKAASLDPIAALRTDG
ncbi:MAG: ABC transporter permease [Ahniella sp.]|nr:ABC transporter permease [Ahniella sp.]